MRKVAEITDCFDVITRGSVIDRLQAGYFLMWFNREDRYDFDYWRCEEYVWPFGLSLPMIKDPLDIIVLDDNQQM
jgi:hypothetical protein